MASAAVETVLERINARSVLDRLRDVVPVSPDSADDPDEGPRTVPDSCGC